MDVKCHITACEILNVATSIVSTRKYGIDCDPAIYCDFTKFYIEVDLGTDKIIYGDEDNYETVDSGSDLDVGDSTDSDNGDGTTDNDGTNDDIILGTISYSVEFTDYACVIFKNGIIPTTTTTTTTTSTTTTTTTTIQCFVEFNILEDYPIEITTTTTTTTTTSTTSTTTTTEEPSACNVQADILEITW